MRDHRNSQIPLKLYFFFHAFFWQILQLRTIRNCNDVSFISDQINKGRSVIYMLHWLRASISFTDVKSKNNCKVWTFFWSWVRPCTLVSWFTCFYTLLSSKPRLVGNCLQNLMTERFLMHLRIQQFQNMLMPKMILISYNMNGIPLN